MKFLNSKTYYISLIIITLLQGSDYIFAGGSAASQAESFFSQGMQKLQKGKTQEALQLFIKAGKLGNSRAYCMAGGIYDSSYLVGVSRNDVLALKYYNLALQIDQNCGPALHGIGVFTYQGRGGIGKNREEAIRLWTQGAAVDDAGCFYDLGVCAIEENRIDEAIILFRKAAPSHNGAAFNLSTLLMTKSESDLFQEGLKWLIFSAKNGHKQAIEKVKQLPCPDYVQMQDPLMRVLSDIQKGKYDNVFLVNPLEPKVFTVFVSKQDSKTVCSGDNCKNAKNLKFCSRCKSTYYCSKECQVADWSRHKVICHPFS